MNNFINRPKRERLELIGQTAARLDMDPAAIEKDFWVCWILQRLFQSPLKKSIIFKGGTCLSKVYGLIKRFSEDIDLILDWSDFCTEYDLNPGQHYGKSGRERMMEALDEWNAQQIAQKILPAVRDCCGDVCSADIFQETPEIIAVTYPRNYESSYIRPRVLLEIGPKAAWNPHAEHTVRPYMAEIYPHLFHGAETSVVASTAERSFWEKITILHSQANRPTALPLRYARHYYDAVMMARNDALKQRAFTDVRLLYQVSSFKYYFYRSGWADYPHAVPGSMHLMPCETIKADLELDYAKMKKEMLPHDAPEFSVLIEEVAKLELEVNQLPPLHLNVRNYPTMEF